MSIRALFLLESLGGGVHLKEGDAAVFFLVCKLGSLFGGCLSSFAQAIFRAFLPSVRRNDVTDDVARARQRLAALRVGPARWAVVGVQLEERIQPVAGPL